MAITIGTEYPGRPWGYGDSESLTQSTATTAQSISAVVPITYLGMGTASGDNRNNLYTLPATTTASGVVGDAVEGMEKFLVATATGEAAVYIEMATGRVPWEAAMMINATATVAIDQAMASATGRWVFSAADDWMRVKFLNGSWKFLGGVGPTMATAT